MNTTNNNQIIAVKVLISGRVQGVSYRYYTQKQAQSLGVNGWVKNLHDGRVEAFFEGDPETVKAMVKWCDQGPATAIVNEVLTIKEIPQNIKGFTILYS